VTTFIHVGYRKTGTSWLQDLYFPSLPLNYIGRAGDNYPRWLIEWHYLDDFAFETNKSRLKNIFSNQLRSDKTNLLSSEAFTNTSVIYSQASRIKEICPEARIIVTLRDPVAMVWSHYTHDILEGDCFSNVEDWLDWDRTPFVLHKRKTIYLPDFYFDEAIDHYRKLFGNEHVCVLKMEDMVHNKENFFNDLHTFLNVDFSVPDDRMLSLKINESRQIASEIGPMKWSNFIASTELAFPSLCKELQGASSSKYLSQNEEEMSELLRKNLEEYFAGKCYGYY
jgi:hypothetical protein